MAELCEARLRKRKGGEHDEREEACATRCVSGVRWKGEQVMPRRTGAAARAKANEVRAKLEAKRKERDDRIVACVQQFATAQESIEDLQARIDQERATAAAALAQMRAEGISPKEIADLLGMPKRDIDRMLRTVKDTTPATDHPREHAQATGTPQEQGEETEQPGDNDPDPSAPAGDPGPEH